MSKYINNFKKRRSWVRRAFFNYTLNKSRLSQLKSDYEHCEIPGTGSGGNGGGKSSDNGVEKSVLHYLSEREKLEKAVKSCEAQIDLVDKTLQHFKVEEGAKGKQHKRYIECRFVKGMSYRRAAIECEVAERTTDNWLNEIFDVAETIAQIEGFLQVA